MTLTGCVQTPTSPTRTTTSVSQPSPTPTPSAPRYINVWFALATESGFDRPIGAVPIWAYAYGSNRQGAIDAAQTSCFGGTGSRRNLCSLDFECPPSSFEDSAHSWWAYASSPLDNLGFNRALACGHTSGDAAMQVAMNLCGGAGRRCVPQKSGSVLPQ